MQTKFKLLSILGIAAAVSSCSDSPSVSGRPNIIYIMSDDHAFQAISAYGGPLKDLAPTPNIDRIASAGMRFDRCLVTNSISGPCRAVVLTGKYSHLNGFLSNEAKEFDGSQQTFPKLLQENGTLVQTLPDSITGRYSPDKAITIIPILSQRMEESGMKGMLQN